MARSFKKLRKLMASFVLMVEILRRKNRKAAIGIGLSSLIILLYIILTEKGYVWYKFANGVKDRSICSQSSEQMSDLVTLIRDTHELLNQLDVIHFPIYGSFWGALRYNKPLPWDNDFDFALIHNNLVSVDEDNLMQQFRARDINIYYRPWFGSYRVTRATARGDLMIFKKSVIDNSLMVRVGFESYVLFLNYIRFHQFPSRLLSKPYSTILFCGKNMSAPHEGIEIQKHFYPNDWWKEAKPFGC